MIKVHHLNQSRSERVIWLLEELALPYEVIHHQRDPQTMLAPKSLQQVHPLAKAPVVEDGETVLCESGAVMEYLLDKIEHTPLRPEKEASNYYAYLEWLHFAEGSFSLPVITSLLLGMETREQSQPIDGYIAKELALDLAHIETRLSNNLYFAGDEFSAADIMMTFLLLGAQSRGLLQERPNTEQFLKRMQERPAFKVAKTYG